MMVKLESDQSATFNIVNTLPKSILSHTKITLDEDLRRYSELNVILVPHLKKFMSSWKTYLLIKQLTFNMAVRDTLKEFLFLSNQSTPISTASSTAILPGPLERSPDSETRIKLKMVPLVQTHLQFLRFWKDFCAENEPIGKWLSKWYHLISNPP